MVRHWIKAFWKAVDDETISLFQNLFYFLLICAGTYGLLVAGGVPQAVEETMTRPFYLLWLGLNVIAPAICLLGKRLKGNFAYSGMWLQLAGDIGSFFALAAYIGAVLETSWWGRGVYAIFIVAMGFAGTMLFLARDVRRLRQVEREVRKWN